MKHRRNKRIYNFPTTKNEFKTIQQGLTLEITNMLRKMNRIGKFPIFCTFIFLVFSIHQFFLGRIFQLIILRNSAFILAVSDLPGIACTLINILSLQVYSFIAQLFCSTAINVTNAVTGWHLSDSMR